ncbi:MAG: hypothetical protein KDI30_03355, partial [Pseudomonadales bacterium]|nr:hypothetical protein [Pseudomonadales bacterium]
MISLGAYKKNVLRKLKFWFLFLSSLFFLITLAGVSFWTFLNSSQGKDWVNQKINHLIPSLVIEQLDYNFEGHLSAENISYRQGESLYQLHKLKLSWQPACLLYAQVCIRNIEAQSLTIEQPPNKNDSEPLTFTLPLPVSIKNLSLPELRYSNNKEKGHTRVENISLTATARYHSLNLQSLKAKVMNYELHASGEIDIKNLLINIHPLSVTNKANNFSLNAEITGYPNA